MWPELYVLYTTLTRAGVLYYTVFLFVEFPVLCNFK